MGSTGNMPGGSSPFWPWFSLTQPINPGWTFGNLTVNEQNSSAPATEAAIVAQESYGRQIGKLLDAVAVLIGEHGTGKRPKEFTELLGLKDKIDGIKEGEVARRVDQIRSDLADLKRNNPSVYKEQVAALKVLLAGEP